MVDKEIEKHKSRLNKLREKEKIAKIKYLENQMRREIFKLYFPFLFNLKFNKLIVMLCILSIMTYTIAAIIIQKFTLMEISPTLTTCVYGFFGTELIGLAGIRIFDKKYETAQPSIAHVNVQKDDDYSAVG